MRPPLYPPLIDIESDLFGEPEDLPPVTAKADDEEADVAPAASHEMPAYLRDLIERTVTSETINLAKPLASGQIRRISAIYSAQGLIRRLGGSCGVLLEAHLGGSRWSGWMVAAESDYACEHDLVLQAEDGLFDPEAAMIQTWNAVEVLLLGHEPLLGELSAARLDAVDRLADWQGGEDHFVLARPGRIGGWNLNQTTVVFTGTPLGEADDPRRAYQQLYARLAQELRVAAQPVASNDAASRRTVIKQGGLLAWLLRPALSPVWGVAALMVVLAQGVWLYGASDGSGSAGAYRGIGESATQENCRASVKVIFKPGISYTDAAVTLGDAGATLFDGPSKNAEVWVLPPKSMDAQTLATSLRRSKSVENAEVVEPAGWACKR